MKEEQQAARQREEEQETQARRELAAAKSSRFFSANWAKKHPAVKVFKSIEEVASDTDAFKEPFIVNGGEAMRKAFADGEAGQKLWGACQKWFDGFMQAPQIGEQHRTQATLKKQHSPEHFQAFVEKLLPVAKRTTGNLPSLINKATDFKFYGWSSSLVLLDYEAHYLGSVRAQTHGSCKVLMASVAELHSTWPAAAGGADSSADEEGAGTKARGSDTPDTLKKMLHQIENATDETVDKLFEHGLRVYHCDVHTTEGMGPTLLYTPPGFALCAVPLNGKNASGVRVSLLMNGPKVMDSLKIAQRFDPERFDPSETLQAWIDVLAIAPVVHVDVVRSQGDLD